MYNSQKFAKKISKIIFKDCENIIKEKSAKKYQNIVSKRLSKVVKNNYQKLFPKISKIIVKKNCVKKEKRANPLRIVVVRRTSYRVVRREQNGLFCI